MRIKQFRIEHTILFLLLVSLADATSLEVNLPEYLVEGESSEIGLSTYSDMGFNGTVFFSYTNVNSGTTIFNFTDADFIGSYYNRTWQITGIAEGAYSIYASLNDGLGVSLTTLNKTSIVEGPAPRITAASPSGTVNKDSVILAVTTNEEATCKYGRENNTYNGLSNTFYNTGKKNHNQTLDGLSEGLHTYYVLCRDYQGYTMNESSIIKFEVDLAPAAQISLSDSSPLKAGTIEVTMIISESLENQPTLDYSFNDAPSVKRQVSLTGSGSVWKGYIIITQEDDAKIGTFYFTATDSSGNFGNRITAGNIFLVDAAKPVPPSSIKGEAQPDGSIKLKWYYDGEQVDKFNIYRSTSSGVSYVDFYAAANGSMQYIDTSTIDKVTYYYKISAVDLAENEGPLSSEVFATSVSKTPKIIESNVQEAIEDVPKVLPPNLIPKVDAFTKKIDTLIIDVKDASGKLDEDSEKKSLIEELKIKEELDKARLSLEELKQRLESFKLSYATESELEAKLKEIDMEARRIEKTTPKDVQLLEKIEYAQAISEDDIKIAAEEILKDAGLTEEENSRYIKLNNKNRNKIKIDMVARVISIKHMDDSQEERTFVTKKLSYQEAERLEDVIVLEIIPKGVAETVNEINFFGEKFEIVKEDPIVKFGFLEFDYGGETISYSLNKRVDLEEIKNAKSVVLLSMSELAKASQITGFSIFPFTNLGLTKMQSIFVWFGVAIIFILGAYYLLFIRDYKYLFKKLYRKLRLRKLNESFDREIQSYKSNNTAVFFNEDIQRKPDTQNFKGAMQIDGRSASALLDELALHINDTKIEMADKLLPFFVALNSKLESKGLKGSAAKAKNNDMFINALIDKAHYYLDNNLHGEAAKIYPKISVIYQSMPKEDKAEIYERCAELHRRMNS